MPKGAINHWPRHIPIQTASNKRQSKHTNKKPGTITYSIKNFLHFKRTRTNKNSADPNDNYDIIHQKKKIERNVELNLQRKYHEKNCYTQQKKRYYKNNRVIKFIPYCHLRSFQCILAYFIQNQK